MQLCKELIRPDAVINPARSPLASLSSMNSNDTGHRLVRLPRGTVKKDSSPNYGNKYQIKQKCAVCLRTRGKCSFTKSSAEGARVMANTCTSVPMASTRKYKGVSEERHCFSWHVCNPMPPY